ncbi:hypothetical protein ACGF7U_20480 [Micromonospora sp. NPDC047670]|uniref:hypothetical protein n=1 Tax=Micromonospora sp. NPDC047670 TaxID=3364252 RepID=UPI003718B904
MSEEQPTGATTPPASFSVDDVEHKVVALAEPGPGEPATEPEGTASDSDQKDEIRPDSLRMDPRVGEELYGAQFSATYSRVNARGVNALGNNNTIHVINYKGQPPAKPIIRDLVEVPELLRVYAGASADAELETKLGDRPTACLAGRSNTGRFSTACVALARRHGADRVHEVMLPAGVGPEVLHRAAESLLEGHGYILRLPGNGHGQAMRLLTDTFRRRAASLLLIRDDDSRAGGRHSAEVQHRRPDPLAVFRAHLKYGLRAQRKLTAEESGLHADSYLQHGDLVQALRNTYGPREVVPIAKAVVDRHPADDDVLAGILRISQPRRRAYAAAILRSDAGGDARRPRRADQHERAFRIAYAVFARQPLHYVFEAAGLLLEEIDGQAKRPDWGRLALQHPVSELLGPLDVDWQEGREAARSHGSSSRSAWLHDGAMRGVIIDEAWHEFDSTRPALLKWLDTLVSDNEEPVQRAAAEVAGLLAHHDFERVCADLVDDWASSPKARVRQAAAWAMVAADMGGQVDHLVRRQVREWAGGRRNYQRDAAARVYASGLQQPDLSWSLADLRRIAEDQMQQHTSTVAEGIYQLYTPHRAHQIIFELAQWSDDRQLQRHAGSALLNLAMRPVDDSPGGPPDLVTRLATNDVDGGDLVRLWRVSLLATELSRHAWFVLGHWLRQADSEELFRKPIEALLNELAAVPALRRRLRFHLVRLAEFEDGLPMWLESAMRKW